MRAAAFSVLSPFSALFALGLLLAPHYAEAAATFTRGDSYPFVSSIALKAGGDFISMNATTQEDITVVISVDPGPTPGNSISGSDSHVFTENGTYTFNFMDAFGATGSSTVTIDNIDRTPPVITIDPFATTSTNGDVSVTVSTNEGTLNASLHTFTENGSFDFVATDQAGNIATSTVTVSNIDRVAPVLSILGDNPLRIKINSTFTDPGVTALDALDGTITVTATGSVDTDTAGTYTRTYVATDAAGNTATTTRTVEVFRSSSGGGGGGSRVLPEATVG